MTTEFESSPHVRFTYEPWWHSQSVPVTFSFDGYHPGDLIPYVMRTQNTFFDLDLLEYTAMVGPQGGTYLDIGANIGNHSVFFARFCADRVLAFEPHPELHAILKNNVRRNGADDRTTLVPVGLSDTAGIGTMQIRNEHKGNIGASHVARSVPLSAKDHIVDLRPLDIFTSGPHSLVHPFPIRFIKIDVEGMEMDVLRGAANTLEEHHPQLLVELITPETARAAVDFLGRFGYEQVAQLGTPPSYHFIDPRHHTLRPNKWSGGTYWSHLIHKAEEELSAATPTDAVLIIADADELGAADRFAGRRRVPFLEQGGRYDGHPSSGAHAIRELERMRGSGATHFILAWPVFWYLDIYPELERHLRANYQCVCESNRVIGFRL
jgi:FkbM family methyltransferase